MTNPEWVMAIILALVCAVDVWVCKMLMRRIEILERRSDIDEVIARVIAVRTNGGNG